MQGKIVRIFPERRFGFIRTRSGENFFFHASGVLGGNFNLLEEEQVVTFDIEEDRRGRGPRAVNVVPL